METGVAAAFVAATPALVIRRPGVDNWLAEVRFSTRGAPNSWVCALAALATALLFNVGAAHADTPPGLLLWNKLGSDEEVTHSEVGPNLVLASCDVFACGIDVPGTLGYPAGVFGGAATVTGLYSPGERVHTALLLD